MKYKGAVLKEDMERQRSIRLLSHFLHVLVKLDMIGLREQMEIHRGFIDRVYQR